jgi:hypothetical protein
VGGVRVIHSAMATRRMAGSGNAAMRVDSRVASVTARRVADASMSRFFHGLPHRGKPC